jgi:hypothetical protein
VTALKVFAVRADDGSWRLRPVGYEGSVDGAVVPVKRLQAAGGRLLPLRESGYEANRI